MTAISQLTFLVIVLLSWQWSYAQNNQQTPDNLKFYLDSSADCNGPVRNVYSTRTTIKGQGAHQSNPGPQSCKISLRTEKPFEVAIFKIEIRSLQIQDCGVTFTIYDGDAGINHLGSYDCEFGKQPNMRPFTTSGNLVTVVLQREDIRNTRYDVNILITPLVAGRDPGYENGNGNDYGYNYHRKFPTEAIVGIVGGLFVAIIIVIVIVSVHCYRKHNRLNKQWEQQPLSYLNTTSNFDTASNISKSNYSDTSSVWASEVSKTNDYRPPHHHRKNRHGDYAESVDDMKRSYSKAGSTRSGRTERSSHPPSYVTATRNSYVGPDDHYPQDSFVERMVPVKSRNASTHSTSVGVDPIDDEEDGLGDEERIESEPEEQESEEEEEDVGEAEDDGRTQPTATRRQPTEQAAQSEIVLPIQQMPPNAVQNPRAMFQPQMMPQQYMPYPPPQQQFMPVQAVPYGLPHAQPVHPPPMYPGHGQNQPEPVRVPSVKPTDPPVYSYLVQRGYTPLDGRQSPASMVSSAASHHSAACLLKEESDSGNLSSGVELMRR